jgi:DNA-binding transcriptional regulator YbjK
MGKVLGFDRKGLAHISPRKSVLRERRFPVLCTQYLEAELPIEKLPLRENTYQWIQRMERALKKIFAPFESSHVSVFIDLDVVYIHIYIDGDLEDDEIVDNGICLRQFLEQDEKILIDDDYVT